MVDENFNSTIDNGARCLVGSDIPDDEFGALGDILLAAAGEVVQNQNLVAVAHQRFGDMTADETGAPCDTDD